MYFWKIDKLIEDFKQGKVSQKSQFKYYILFVLVSIFFYDPVFYIDSKYSLYDSINTFLTLMISAWGIYNAYKNNSSGDNQEFISRVMCLGLPAAIRVIAIFLPIILVSMISVEIIKNILIERSIEYASFLDLSGKIFSYLISLSITFSYYFYLGRKIKQISAHD